MSEDRFTKVSIKQKKTVDIPRHEILMSFVNDSGARDFYRWWNNDGAKLFQKWLNNK